MQDPKVVMHERYCFTDGSVSLQVEGVLYHVHRCFLEADSSFFDLHDMTLDRIVLYDITTRDLDIFLSIFYPKETGVFDAATLDEWSSILHLADKWGFKTIKRLAVSKLLPLATPIEMIVLGRRYSIDNWVILDALDSLCLQSEPLTLEEGYSLGMETVIKVMSIRQEYDLGTRSYICPSIPTLDTLRIHFDLPDAVHPSSETSFIDEDHSNSHNHRLSESPPQLSDEQLVYIAYNKDLHVNIPGDDSRLGRPYWPILTKDQYLARLKAEAECSVL